MRRLKIYIQACDVNINECSHVLHAVGMRVLSPRLWCVSYEEAYRNYILQSALEEKPGIDASLAGYVEGYIYA